MLQPKKAFVLAAGLGTRMRPLTDNLPKPMLEVEGRSMLDRALDKLLEIGVEEAVVNSHYKAEVLNDHLAKRKDIKISISHEPIRLETGGGILNGLHLIGDEPFYVISSDVVWQGSGLKDLAENYDGLGALLVHEVARSYGYDGNGDFDLNGKSLSWKQEGKDAKYVFTGLQILNPEVFKRSAVKELGDNFPLSKLYKLYLSEFVGVENKGNWYHIGTPESLKNVKLANE